MTRAFGLWLCAVTLSKGITLRLIWIRPGQILVAGGGGDRLAQLSDHRQTLEPLLVLAAGLLVEIASGGGELQGDQQGKAQGRHQGQPGKSIAAATQPAAFWIDHHRKRYQHQGDQGQEPLGEQKLDQTLQPARINQPQWQGGIEHHDGKDHQEGRGPRTRGAGPDQADHLGGISARPAG